MRFAGGDADLAVPDRADADLRALQILENADRAGRFGLQRADRGVNLGVILMRAVAEIEPERVDAREEQLLQHLGR